MVDAQIYMRSVATAHDPLVLLAELWVPPADTRRRGFVVGEAELAFADAPRNQMHGSESPRTAVQVDEHFVRRVYAHLELRERMRVVEHSICTDVLSAADPAMLTACKHAFWLATPDAPAGGTVRWRVFRPVAGQPTHVATFFRLAGDNCLVELVPSREQLVFESVAAARAHIDRLHSKSPT
jgi:hypothetical protein